MVHALEKATRLLADDGVLIDIHPTSEPAHLEVRVAGAVEPAGVVMEASGGVEYHQADAAIAKAVRRGMLRRDGSDLFTFLTHAASLEELRDHLADAWTDAIIEDASAMRVEQLLREAGAGGEVMLRERVRISRLRATRRGPTSPTRSG